MCVKCGHGRKIAALTATQQNTDKTAELQTTLVCPRATVCLHQLVTDVIFLHVSFKHPADVLIRSDLCQVQQQKCHYLFITL